MRACTRSMAVRRSPSSHGFVNLGRPVVQAGGRVDYSTAHVLGCRVGVAVWSRSGVCIPLPVQITMMMTCVRSPPAPPLPSGVLFSAAPAVDESPKRSNTPRSVSWVEHVEARRAERSATALGKRGPCVRVGSPPARKPVQELP